jgi:hypothetical protein
MEGLLPLAALIGASGSILYATFTKKRKEGFNASVESVEAAMGPTHNQFVKDGASRFNPLMNLMNPAANPLYPDGSKPSDAAIQTQKVKQALVGALATPMNPSFQLSPLVDNSIAINLGSGGIGPQAIKVCEKLKEINCDAFDDPNFAFSCGVCHEGGKDSGGNSVVGGLYILEDAKESAEVNAKRMGSRRVNYTPSVGSCSPGKFSVTKEQCLRLKNQMECKAKQSFDVPGCSQCYQDETFQYIGKDILRGVPSLFLSGSGAFSITLAKTGFKKSGVLADAPQRIELSDFQEGDILQIKVDLETGAGFVAGYLQGTTASGEFSLDLARIVKTDAITNQTPRLSGQLLINGENYTLMRPGRGQKTMQLVVQNPFTFIDPSETEEAAACSASPYITKQTSAEFLNSGVCFKKGQGPGKFSLECLQNLFTNAGCDTKGEAYPTDEKSAKALMTGANGQLLRVAEIAQTIYDASQYAYTGMKGGEKLSIPEWDSYSRFCTGKRITSPCDGDNKESGPLSTECLSYLWQNKGAADKNPGGTGPTYTNVLSASSLDGRTSQFCTRAGTMAPINANGQVNAAAVAEARKAGGVEAVKSLYNTIHLKANDNSLKDGERRSAIEKCYGIGLNELPSNTLEAGVNETTCVPQTKVPSMTGVPKDMGLIDVNDNWIWSFSITPTGTSDSWASLFLVNQGGATNRGNGSRMPALYFFPGKTRLVASIVGKNNQICDTSPEVELPLNKVTNVYLSYIDGKVTLKYTGAVQAVVTNTCPECATGPATFYATSPWNPSFVGRITNLSYCTFQSKTKSVLDYKPGRTKTPMQQRNYEPMDWSKASKPVSVLASWGQGPWGTWWASSFPGSDATKWIWSNPGALANEPSTSFFSFFKRWTNTTGAPIRAKVWVAIDNAGSLFVNDNLVGNNTSNLGVYEITLPVGESKIQVDARNGGGPAGVLFVAKSGDSTLFASDSTWTFGTA